MAEAITVARPYAQAAFDEARGLDDLKGWSNILQSIAEAVINPEIHAIITSPRAVKSQLAELMLALCGDKVSETQRNFIKLLVESQRLSLLPEIVMLFEIMRAEAEKENAWEYQLNNKGIWDYDSDTYVHKVSNEQTEQKSDNKERRAG
jgi:F-type H+-transporting ATPase subunit delta